MGNYRLFFKQEESTKLSFWVGQFSTLSPTGVGDEAGRVVWRLRISPTLIYYGRTVLHPQSDADRGWSGRQLSSAVATRHPCRAGAPGGSRERHNSPRIVPRPILSGGSGLICHFRSFGVSQGCGLFED